MYVEGQFLFFESIDLVIFKISSKRLGMWFSNTPKRHLYPIVGFFLAVGAPGGLLLMRLLTSAELFSWSWVINEITGSALTYGYIAVSTAIMFVGLGTIIGSHEDLLQRVSLTDPLTGLPNRRHFDQRLREDLARVERFNHTLTLMLLDLDGLKDINDLAGHKAGDNALRAVARTLSRNCRTTDLVARIGGDEFTVLASNMTEKEAQSLANRIREALTADRGWVSTSLPPLSLSVGVADTRCVEKRTPDFLYSAADEALYKAKQSGRNVVVHAAVSKVHAGSDTPKLGDKL